MINFRSLLLLISVIIFTDLLAQEHFEPVQSTGLPYIIIVNDAKVNGVEIKDGSEIGVFDDSLCVGAAYYFKDSASTQITTWQESPSYDLRGFTPGDSIKFKVWTEINGDWLEIMPFSDYQVGDGTFGYGIYTIVNISKTVSTTSSFSNRKSSHIEVYPNPFNNHINIHIPVLKEKARVIISSILGDFVKEIRLENNQLSDRTIVWNGRNDKGNQTSSGVYYLSLVTQNNVTTKKIIYLK